MDYWIDDSDQLKLCPFCGAVAEIVTLEGEDGDVGIGAQCVQCTACGSASGLIYPLMDDVTNLLYERWNRRQNGIKMEWQPIEIEQLQAKVAELGAEVERLKRTNSSYANLTKAQESQLTNLRQRLYQLKGADSAIDSERQANCDLTEQLAAEQLNNKLLRDALEFLNARIVTMDLGGVVERALSPPASTEALDKYVAEKVKEAMK